MPADMYLGGAAELKLSVANCAVFLADSHLRGMLTARHTEFAFSNEITFSSEETTARPLSCGLILVKRSPNIRSREAPPERSG